MSNTTKQLPCLKLGEIFEYEIDNEGETDKIKALFLKVGGRYYAVTIDNDDNTLSFFDEIAGSTFEGKQREGKNPFNYKEALEYLKARNVKATGKMLVQPKKANEKPVPAKYPRKKTTNEWA